MVGQVDQRVRIGHGLIGHAEVAAVRGEPEGDRDREIAGEVFLPVGGEPGEADGIVVRRLRLPDVIVEAAHAAVQAVVPVVLCQGVFSAV